MVSPLRPGHVAVLVRTNRHAVTVRDALDAVGVPAVINGAGSVFATPAAREWLRLLEALERPASPVRARAATMTSFLGWTAERVAAASDDEWEDVHRRLHAWAGVLRRRGLASLTETITLVERLPGRVLSVVDGERRLTDLRHVGQLLHSAAAAESLGTAALAVWLRQRVDAAEREGDEERSRRLESDAQAVQVLTIHRSKGLEFPVVYVPYLWEPTWVDEKPCPIVYHDPDVDFTRTIDVGLAGESYKRHKEQHVDEQRGEDLRLAYVALTRAKHQAVVWWAGSWNSRDSALSRLLFARDADGNVASSGQRPPSDETAIARFRELAEAAPGCISVALTERLGLPVAWSDAPLEPAELAASIFDRPLDRDWRRTSYSDITADAHEARVASEPEESIVTDEPADDEPRPALAPAPRAPVGGDSPAGIDAPGAPPRPPRGDSPARRRADARRRRPARRRDDVPVRRRPVRAAAGRASPPAAPRRPPTPLRPPPRPRRRRRALARRPPRPRPTRRSSPSPRCSRPGRAGRRSARSPTPSSRPPTSPRPTSTPSSRGRSARRSRGGRSTSATARR